MEVLKIKIFNYRNFPQTCPLEMEINNGINFVLGINNAGKSNLLRFFFDFRGVVDSFVNDITNRKFEFSAGFYFDHAISKNSKEKRIKFELSYGGSTIIFNISPQKETNLHSQNLYINIETSGIDMSNNAHVETAKIMCRVFSKSLYVGTNRANIHNTSGSYYDIEVGQNFINNWSQWADGEDTEKMEKISRLINDIRILFNYQKFNIRLNNGRNNLFVTTDDGDFLLTDMGSGISHFIIVLANILIKEPSLILIDEPEQNLHPWLQEVFVRALASRAKCGLIASSHSIGLARSTSDHVYSMIKEDKFSRLQKYGEHFPHRISQSISEMCYSQFTEIGGNNILLVEGRTDVKCFREILRKFGIENKFIVLSFGGRQFITKDETKVVDELNEINRFNAASVSVIFDSERTSENTVLKPEFQTFIKVCSQLQFNVFSTDRHSTENYITQEALDKVLGKGYIALEPYQHFNTLDNKWRKELNWKLFSEMDKSDFEGTGLYDFIENILKQKSLPTNANRYTPGEPKEINM